MKYSTQSVSRHTAPTFSSFAALTLAARWGGALSPPRQHRRRASPTTDHPRDQRRLPRHQQTLKDAT
ncbi:hypothetical protein HMPREF9057_01991 [Actinomyces sp. oral taxon 171 str. F0337]|nr:hypothetical protein HMPREF9057_01991 [Actinomyces sp. oral taxon 171 str. F0337]